MSLLCLIRLGPLAERVYFHAVFRAIRQAAKFVLEGRQSANTRVIAGNGEQRTVFAENPQTENGVCRKSSDRERCL